MMGNVQEVSYCTHNTRFYRKVPGLGQIINAGLTYSILAAISFKIASLGTYTAIPSFFLCFRINVEVIFLNVVKYHHPLDVSKHSG
jgi:hypothetical protein